MQGKIVKAIAGFYYVDVPSDGVYTCKARGVFRRAELSPLVGDDVEIEETAPLEGNIVRICPRRNSLIRPAVANVDLALVVFAAVKPEPNFNLLDRFLIYMESQGIDSVICFNKADLASDAELDRIRDIYRDCGHRVFTVSVLKDQGIEEIRELLRGRTAVLAGPSGVGKSSMMNRLQPEACMETGDLSARIDRGKQTTRHTELICLEEGTYLTDTPGFSSLFVNDIEKEKLQGYFAEFAQYEPYCRFMGCRHLKEPDCRVKEALEEGLISRVRYEDYVQIYEEISSRIKYK